MVDAQTGLADGSIVVVSDVVAPVQTRRTLDGFILKDGHAVRDVHDHAASGAQPDATTKSGCLVIGDEGVHEMGVVGLRRNVDTATLIMGAVSFDQSGVELYGVGDHVDATTSAGGAVVGDASAVHGEPCRGDLGPLVRPPFAEVLFSPAGAVGIDLPVRAGITVDVHVHRVHATTIRCSVAVDGAAIHRDIRVAEDADAATREGSFAL